MFEALSFISKNWKKYRSFDGLTKFAVIFAVSIQVIIFVLAVFFLVALARAF